MRKFLMLGLMSAVLAGCVHGGRAPSAWIDPGMAVQLAAAAGLGRGVDGVFALNVRATGDVRGSLFLNSERDYRDPRNLSVELMPAARAALADRLGRDPRQALLGRPILVRGSARLVKVVFIDEGRVTDKYYYQTQVMVSDAAQVQLR